MRTKIKICGITRLGDGLAAAKSGADAIGFIQWRKSPRYIEPGAAAAISAHMPPLVSVVAVYVNPTREEVLATLAAIPSAILQFHGEEDAAFCASFGRPWIKAVGAKADRDLLKYFSQYKGAAAWLIDAFDQQHYGGTGHSVDLKLVPSELERPLILSGGLNSSNVGSAISEVRPYAVDVSSGVEVAKGIKDEKKMTAFVAEVNRADQRS